MRRYFTILCTTVKLFDATVFVQGFFFYFNLIFEKIVSGRYKHGIFNFPRAIKWKFLRKLCKIKYLCMRVRIYISIWICLYVFWTMLKSLKYFVSQIYKMFIVVKISFAYAQVLLCGEENIDLERISRCNKTGEKKSI